MTKNILIPRLTRVNRLNWLSIMTYYLDTSVLRSHGKRLRTVSPRFRVRTSSLAITEILTGIPHEAPDFGRDDKEFLRRRSSLLALHDSSVSINDMWLDERIDLAFQQGHSRVGENKYFADAVRQLDKVVCQSPDYASFLAMLKNEALLEKLVKLKAFDEHTSKSFTTTTNQAIKESMLLPSESTVSPTRPRTLRDIRDHLNSEAGIQINYSSALLALASRVAGLEATTELVHDMPDEIEEIYQSYTGELDVFLFAWAISSVDAIANEEAWGRNDGMDLLHLCFLEEDDTFVTSDRKITRLAANANRILGLKVRTLTPEEFFLEVRSLGRAMNE
jgi:hypothetical protein